MFSGEEREEDDMSRMLSKNTLTVDLSSNLNDEA